MTDAPQIGAAWRAVRDRFRLADIDTPELDARLLAEAAFGLDRLALTMAEQLPAAPEAVQRLDAFAARRLDGEPVARILGHKEFYGLDFALNGATLVPRPETELLVELAIELLAPLPEPVFADLGTGTGCLAIAILVHCRQARAIATDLSHDALAAAADNAERYGVQDRLSLRLGSWLEPIAADEKLDLIVANPPYIETDIIPQLAPEIARFDPLLALDGGDDGLAAYRAIAEGAPGRLKRYGQLLVEIGSEQGIEVGALLSTDGFADIDIRKDLNGLDRVVRAYHMAE